MLWSWNQPDTTYQTLVLKQVPDSLRRELANVCRACFSGEGVARHGALVAAYRAQFVAELNPEVRSHA